MRHAVNVMETVGICNRDAELTNYKIFKQLSWPFSWKTIKQKFCLLCQTATVNKPTAASLPVELNQRIFCAFLGKVQSKTNLASAPCERFNLFTFPWDHQKLLSLTHSSASTFFCGACGITKSSNGKQIVRYYLDKKLFSACSSDLSRECFFSKSTFFSVSLSSTLNLIRLNRIKQYFEAYESRRRITYCDDEFHYSVVAWFMGCAVEFWLKYSSYHFNAQKAF